MSILHLNPEIARQASQTLQRATQESNATLDALRSSVKQLDAAWEGGSADEYMAELERLSFNLVIQVEILQLLISRLDNEIHEWVMNDILGSLAFKTNRNAIIGALTGLAIPTVAGGSGDGTGHAVSIWPVTTAISIESILAGLPAWLRSILGKFFPPEPPIISPLPDHPDVNPQPDKPYPFQEKPVPETLPDIITPDNLQPTPGIDQWEMKYDVPAKSQGDLYGSAACAPTSVSMVLDYFHAKDSSLNTASPQDLIGMMDKGDGTPGQGMSLSNLTDELNDLGYKNILGKGGASMTELQDNLKNGPVIVTTGVKITGPGTVNSDVPRAIEGPGSTTHAMVVTAISEEKVAVNDPWTGSQMEFSMDTFEDMWTRGQNGLYAIQP